MAIFTGRSGGAHCEINVTPLIDVLLVLLVTFLVIQPYLSRGLDARIPASGDGGASEQTIPTFVVEVQANGELRLNNHPIAEPQLAARLQAAGARVCFVRGAGDLRFESVVRVIDAIRSADVQVGLMK